VDYQGVFSIKYALLSRAVRHDRLWQGVVCIKCGSMWVGTYTRIYDSVRTGEVKVSI